MVADPYPAAAIFPTAIALGSNAALQIEREAARCYPNEACGLLMGRRIDDRVIATDLIICENVAANPKRHFEIASSALIGAHKAARRQGQIIVGHFHSHPDGPAAPSQADAAAIADPHAVWLVQSVRQDGPGTLAAFCPDLNGTGFKSLALSIREI